MRPRLASSPTTLAADYDVVVVGSGYGGAVMAARLAEAGASVAILERGREHRPGEFPESLPALAAATQLHARLPGLGPRTFGRDDALFRFDLGDGFGALTGVGVGGTSLINAGVILTPRLDRARGARRALPEALEADRALAEGYAAARAMLAPEVPASPRLGRLQALAAQPGFTPAPLAVFHHDGPSPAGVAMRACNACGNCITGCNVGAKGTLDTNYLARAVQAGARLFAGVRAERVYRAAPGWRLALRIPTLARDGFTEAPLELGARVVVLAGGSLGSTELLWRSRAAGLAVSSRLGLGFSGNGTLIGFTIGVDPRLAALGEASRGASGSVGPTLLGMFDLRDALEPMIVQDTAIPRALVGALLPLLGATRGEQRRVLAWSVTAGDRGEGRLVVRDGRLHLSWPGAGREAVAHAVDAELQRLARAVGGEHRPNPAWRFLPGAPILTTHPLGGCAIGAHGRDGVVDLGHQVFQGDADTTHPDLYVVDGANFRGALGSNPAWTIAALAERAAAQVVARGLRARPWPRGEPSPPAVGVRFTERMVGWLSPTADPAPAPSPRPPDAVDLSFVLTVAWPDAEALAHAPDTEAHSLGTLECGLLNEAPLMVAEGRFRLFVDTAAGVRMQHRFTAVARDGTRFEVRGDKHLVDDPGPDLWHDTRTLFVEVDRDGVRVGHGVVQTDPRDLARQVTTIVGDAPALDLAADLGARATFLRTFLGRVRAVYGGLVLPLVR